MVLDHLKHLAYLSQGTWCTSNSINTKLSDVLCSIGRQWLPQWVIRGRIARSPCTLIIFTEASWKFTKCLEGSMKYFSSGPNSARVRLHTGCQAEWRETDFPKEFSCSTVLVLDLNQLSLLSFNFSNLLTINA